MSKTAITSPNSRPPVGPFSRRSKSVVPLFQRAGCPGPGHWEGVEGGVVAETGGAFPESLGGSQGGRQSFDDVVRAGVYLRSMSDFAAMNGIYAKHFSQPYRPARRSRWPRCRLGLR